jgi:hypothetical protein
MNIADMCISTIGTQIIFSSSYSGNYLKPIENKAYCKGKSIAKAYEFS